MQLRPYQAEAVDAIFEYWNTEPGNPLVELATGTGKSLIAAELVHRLLSGWPDMRIISVTHVAELIEQNFLELAGIYPFLDCGIWSAGLGRRDKHNAVTFAGIQTVWNKAAVIGHVDVLLVDEAHLVPAKSATMYGKFIAALRDINPDMKIVGLTATPYRLDSGRLDEGDDRLFDRVVYVYGIADGIRDGYLASLSSKHTATALDMRGVSRLGGDYKQSDMAAAVDRDDVTRAAVAEIVAKGHDRRSWLCFCAGVEHARHVRDEIRCHGISAEMVTGDTPKDERRRIIEDHRAGRVRAVTNNSVLTTGYNNPNVDLIAALRPTLSSALYVQIMGRGTRPVYAPGTDRETTEGRLAGIAAGPKPNCLVLDFAGLVRQHGPVDMVVPKKPGSGSGEAPVKQCPECEELVHASVRECPACGYAFPPSEEAKHEARADVAPILSTAPPEWHSVGDRIFRDHHKEGMPTSIKCSFFVGMRAQNEWFGPGHSGFMKAKADRFWKVHGGALPFPKSAEEFLNRAGELFDTAEIELRPNKQNRKYQDVVGWRPGTMRGTPANDNWRGDNAAADDEIPF